jgi:UDP-GlcNAc:undecaprenyl-phosphate GlcNAc-1-phosphate transferase
VDTSSDLLLLIVPLGAALTVSALATPVVSRLARALDVIDRPNERKVNRRENIPLLGGLAVALGFVVGLACAVLFFGEERADTSRLEGLLIGGSLLLLLGAVDDRSGLSARSKLLVELLAAGIAWAYGFRVDFFTEPFNHTTFPLPAWISLPATLVWVVGITNAVNLIDGLDGLATGLGAIVSATLAVICWQSSQLAGVLFGVALLGALAGFLPFNFPPARIFLGDTGALFLGYSLSLLALMGYRKAALLPFVVPLLALAVPILDTGLSVFRRLRSGRPIFDADRMHMHHRLLEAEGSDRAAVLSLYFLTACFCIIAVSFTRLEGFAAILFLVAVVLLTIRLLRNLGVLSSVEPNGAETESEGR